MSVGSVTADQARYLCDSADIGYSQPERRSWYSNADEKGYVTSPQNADCSSLACGCVNFGLHVAYGVPWGHPAMLEIDDYWTGNMRGGLESRGFPEVHWDDNSMYPDGGFQDGDIVLSAANEGGTGHVVVIVDAANGYLSEAWIAEDGSIDGYAGDQTGGETRTVPYASHPVTVAGRWTSCHRFDAGQFLAKFPEFSGGSTAPAPAPAPAPPAQSAAPEHAHGIDVSSHQSDIDLSVTPADFVIVKVSEDDDYVNPAMNQQCAGAVTNGKRLGLYHFARPGDAVSQADYFLATAGGWALGNTALWLDWEANAVPQGPGWALAWLQRVESRTGRIPGIYMNGGALNGYDWSAVASRYPLWYAGGPDYSDYGAGYSDPTPPSLSWWGTPMIHQYTEDGRLPGWGGTLDLNRLASRAMWDSMAGASAAPADPHASERTDGYGVMAVTGEWSTRTAQRFARVMNAWDYPEVFAVANLARYLNSTVGEGHIEVLTGKKELPVDGAWTSDLYRVFQFWAWNYVPGLPECDVWQKYTPNWTFTDFVSGQWNRGTCAVFQEALNRSWGDTGRLMWDPNS